VRSEHLRAGMHVMVLVGEVSSEINDHPPVVCAAKVVEPDGPHAPGPPRWWLLAWTGGHVPPLPQSYSAEEILGIPALGLTWDRTEGDSGD